MEGDRSPVNAGLFDPCSRDIWPRALPETRRVTDATRWVLASPLLVGRRAVALVLVQEGGWDRWGGGGVGRSWWCWSLGWWCWRWEGVQAPTRRPAVAA